MNPYTGELYSTRQEAIDDGVKNPVEVTGRPDDIEHVSRTIASAHRAKIRRKMARQSRRNNR